MKDYSGAIYHNIYVVNKILGNKYNFKCYCGKIFISNVYDIIKNKTKSCGCLKSAQLSQRNKNNSIHGMWLSPIYKAWSSMISRCYNKNNDSYVRYGGRGITVCDEWRKDFLSFYKDMGERPDGYSIERKNYNLGYFKDNCIWATSKQQANNRSTNKLIEYNGEIKTLSEWSEITGIKSCTLSKRLKYGWSIKDTLTRPCIK